MKSSSSSSSSVIGKYKLIEQIGKGSFGLVYKGYHINTKDIVAVKLEKRNKNSSEPSKLLNEAKLYKKLSHKNIPKVEWLGKSKKWNVLVMEFLGPSLEELFEYCNNKFSLKTVLLITFQVLNAIEKIHSSGIIHRDIKPDNFLIGYGDHYKKIYIIDFGLSKNFMNNNTFQHNDYKRCKQFTGSFRYCSIKNHKGIEQSRRDDLESIGYMLLYFLKGRLPWQGMIADSKKEKMKKIYNKKVDTDIKKLCKDCPEEFITYLKYCKRLRYSEKPDYRYLKQIFKNLFKKHNFKYDYKYDWDLKDK